MNKIMGLINSMKGRQARQHLIDFHNLQLERSVLLERDLRRVKRDGFVGGVVHGVSQLRGLFSNPVLLKSMLLRKI